MKLDREKLRNIIKSILKEIRLSVGNDYNDRPNGQKFQTNQNIGADTIISSRQNLSSSSFKGDYYEDEEDSLDEFSAAGAVGGFSGHAFSVNKKEKNKNKK